VISLFIEEKVAKSVDIKAINTFFLNENIRMILGEETKFNDAHYKLRRQTLEYSLSISGYIDTQKIEKMSVELAKILASNVCVEVCSSSSDPDYVVANALRASWGEDREAAENGLEETPAISSRSNLDKYDILCSFKMEDKKKRSSFVNLFTECEKQNLGGEVLKTKLVNEVSLFLDLDQKEVAYLSDGGFIMPGNFSSYWIEEVRDFLFIYFSLENEIDRSELNDEEGNIYLNGNEIFCEWLSMLVYFAIDPSEESTFRLKLRDQSRSEEKLYFRYGYELCSSHREGIRDDNDWEFGV